MPDAIKELAKRSLEEKWYFLKNNKPTVWIHRGSSCAFCEVAKNINDGRKPSRCDYCFIGESKLCEYIDEGGDINIIVEYLEVLRDTRRLDYKYEVLMEEYLETFD